MILQGIAPVELGVFRKIVHLLPLSSSDNFDVIFDIK